MKTQDAEKFPDILIPYHKRRGALIPFCYAQRRKLAPDNCVTYAMQYVYAYNGF